MPESDYHAIEREALAEKLDRVCPYNDHHHLGFALVNVLEPEHFARARIPGSANIPLREIDRFETLFSKAKEIVVYGASPQCDASEKVARDLARRGFQSVYDYKGGLSAWKAGGGALIGGAPAPPARESLRRTPERRRRTTRAARG